jgi:hypothetical protein
LSYFVVLQAGKNNEKQQNYSSLSWCGLASLKKRQQTATLLISLWCDFVKLNK